MREGRAYGPLRGKQSRARAWQRMHTRMYVCSLQSATTNRQCIALVCLTEPPPILLLSFLSYKTCKCMLLGCWLLPLCTHVVPRCTVLAPNPVEKKHAQCSMLKTLVFRACVPSFTKQGFLLWVLVLVLGMCGTNWWFILELEATPLQFC